MSPYHYPDFDDNLVGKFLERFEKNDLYWRKSENEVISFIFNYLINKPGFIFDSFLDAGCGKGRLLEDFAKPFRKIVAVEPDPDRFKHALLTAQELFPDNRAVVRNLPAESFSSNERFDLILCSHVIQHIHTDTVMPLMQNLGDHLTENGVIAVTTCHSVTDSDYFRKYYISEGQLVKEHSEENDFNSLIECKGVLPIHFFHAEKFISDLAAAGFNTSIFRVFHVSKEDRDQLLQPDVDMFVNNDPGMQKRYGIDMLLILEKQHTVR